MAENLKRQPKKGILKNSSSFESNERQTDQKPVTKWDEMNILATLHPAGKDYGHMKIEEPKTPYNYAKDTSGSGDELDSFDAHLLAQRMQQGSGELPRAMVTPPPIPEDSEEDEDISPEERELRQKFEVKRKMHYNEFQAVKLARKLMEQDSDEEEDDKDEQHNKDVETEDANQTDTAADADDSSEEDKEADATKDSENVESMEN